MTLNTILRNVHRELRQVTVHFYVPKNHSQTSDLTNNNTEEKQIPNEVVCVRLRACVKLHISQYRLTRALVMLGDMHALWLGE